jgi:lon-related putative ATP-dependent protease
VLDRGVLDRGVLGGGVLGGDAPDAGAPGGRALGEGALHAGVRGYAMKVRKRAADKVPVVGIAPLPAPQLRRSCDPAELAFATTAELPDLERVIGQDRAIEAIAFGISIRQKGYNLFALGPPGLGKHSAVRRLLEERARGEPRPPDVCFVHDFEQPQRPRLLSLPAGRGGTLRADMQRLLAELFGAIPAALESERFRAGITAIEREFDEKEAEAFRALGQEALKRGLALVQTPQGFVLLPAKRNAEPMAESEFEKLPEAERARLNGEIERFHERVQKLMLEVPRWRRERHARVREFGRETVRVAIAPLFDELEQRYADLEAARAFVAAIREDALENFGEFVREQPDRPKTLVGLLGPEHALHRYQVNVLVDHGRTEGAPIVVEDNPTLPNLVGRIEHLAQMGMLVTNFTLIRSGALHRANGGYLLLDAHKLLTQPFSWEALKRALTAGEARIESVAHDYGLVSTVSLEPEPVPLALKVVLFGERRLYYLLAQLDPDFNELFKVAADFQDEMARTPENQALLASLVATLARRYGLRPVEREAMARVIDQASRLASDATKLSLHVRSIVDLVREADHQAGSAGRAAIAAGDIEAAVAAQLRRADRAYKRWQEEILRNAILIDTEGEQAGEVNGLAAMVLGNVAFGHPVRITATARLGEGEMIDIEREVELGGPIHSKGVLILSSFLAARYSTNMPLSLNASLVFEQSYAEVEGDSASLAELCALLSALSDVPIRQSLAITGSVNQLGQVQAVGAVNEKIEGFFDICASRGLTGRQGVLIPFANREHLMLREDVVEAARAGRFHVYAVRNVDEAVEILTGVPAGEPSDEGEVPEGSINYLVARRLVELSMLRQQFAGRNVEAVARPEAAAAGDAGTPEKPGEPEAPKVPGAPAASAASASPAASAAGGTRRDKRGG